MTQPIFNSLGSNYNLKSAIQFLLHKNSPCANPIDRLKKQVNKKNLIFFSQGRHAITYALTQIIKTKNQPILTQAFTCWAVESAIIESGNQPVFVDIDPQTLNYDLKDLSKKIHKHRPKAIIVQHTLANPAPIEKIQKLCQKHKVLIIEDLAHSYGQSLSQKSLGASTDFTMFSFGRDKMLDSITGGALAFDSNHRPEFSRPFSFSIKHRLYPLLTYLIRTTYNFGIGKLLHFGIKSFDLFPSPIISSKETGPVVNLPSLQIALDQIQTSFNHRKKITTIYQKNLRVDFQLTSFHKKKIGFLRYPIMVKNRQELLNKLKKRGFYLSDIWYRQPVAIGSLKLDSVYQNGSCPQAEQVAQLIFNLPTHININLNQASSLSYLINQYAKAV